MPSIDEQDEVAFFERSPDRGLAIVLPAIVDNHLTKILKVAMRSNATVWNELFNPSGPLGSFGARVRLAYMLELISPKFYKDLLIINKIRNEFAHKVNVKSFDQHPISAWIKAMDIYSTLVRVRDGGSMHPDLEFNRVLRFILKDDLESMRDTFRTSIRLIIAHMTKIEKQVAEYRNTLPPAPA